MEFRFDMKKSIQELMRNSGVAFGTSGARGLATAMTDLICYCYTRGFLQFLEDIGQIKRRGERVAIGGDLRPSTDRIMEAVCRAAEGLGYTPMSCGKVPSPALALYGMREGIPAIMVTGSHIPDDRNGIKFNKVNGEVLKEDESGITRQFVEWPDDLFDSRGAFRQPAGAHRPIHMDARLAYVKHYTEAFGGECLRGTRMGVYQHSAVGRDVLVEIYQALGAKVTPLGRSDRFIPVDTEAIRPEDVQLAREWVAKHHFDTIVSADGDSDRPLISDERGEWLRGDVAGILCAKFLGADSVSTPVSCNTAVEKCGWFMEVRRTRIGSPHVVKSMHEATTAGAKCVVGYEANGGFLLNSTVDVEGIQLTPLPTRDAVIVHLGVLLLARKQGLTISQLVGKLPQRFSASDRLKEFPTEQSRAILAKFSTGKDADDLAAFGEKFGKLAGKPVSVNHTDGLRVTFENEEIVHLRPSGNAPEFRCYTEAASEARARELNAACLGILNDLAA